VKLSASNLLHEELQRAHLTFHRGTRPILTNLWLRNLPRSQATKVVRLGLVELPGAGSYQGLHSNKVRAAFKAQADFLKTPTKHARICSLFV
jgi:alanine-alpha-ketoisovalerate/valine-pyruvate aminotransferase